jgi:uncharacterized phage infection (PIP) family protein YhgE
MKKYLFPNSNLPEMMLIVLVVWLCSLALIGLLVTPLFGAQVGLTVAAVLLVALLALCWGICLDDLVKRGRS